MPLYEYECTVCKRHTEKIQKFSDPEITACPHCGGLLERVITAPAIAFKGGGWYADGYGNAKPAAASSGGDSGGSSESKPAGDSAASSSTPSASESKPAAPAPAPAASSSDKK